MLIRTTVAEWTDTLMEPLETSSALLVEVGQATSIPVCVRTGLDTLVVDVGTARSKRPVPARQQLFT